MVLTHNPGGQKIRPDLQRDSGRAAGGRMGWKDRQNGVGVGGTGGTVGHLAQGGGGHRLQPLGWVLNPVSRPGSPNWRLRVVPSILADLQVAPSGLLCITQGKVNIFSFPQVVQLGLFQPGVWIVV